MQRDVAVAVAESETAAVRQRAAAPIPERETLLGQPAGTPAVHAPVAQATPPPVAPGAPPSRRLAGLLPTAQSETSAGAATMEPVLGARTSVPPPAGPRPDDSSVSVESRRTGGPTTADRRSELPDVPDDVSSPEAHASTTEPRKAAALARPPATEQPRNPETASGPEHTVHIGNVEVRISKPQQPAPPQTIVVAAPPKQAPRTPLARGFSSSIGLRQG
ncbi:MAG TPA: hypothetical protein VF713_03185 [Thermoanaerobaculia bacterium]